MPWTYRQAMREWRAFLAEARRAMDLVSDNATYTAVGGVLRAFRRRLAAQEAVDFALVLPSVLRAQFVADWKIEDPVPPGSRDDWTAEAQALQPPHNLTPANCVLATAIALRTSVFREDLDPVLATLPPFAVEFWSTPGIDPATLWPRIV